MNSVVPIERNRLDELYASPAEVMGKYAPGRTKLPIPLRLHRHGQESRLRLEGGAPMRPKWAYTSTRPCKRSDRAPLTDWNGEGASAGSSHVEDRTARRGH